MTFTQSLDRVCDTLVADQLERHAWLIPAAEQVRQWKAEDEIRRAEITQSRDGGGETNKPLPSNL